MTNPSYLLLPATIRYGMKLYIDHGIIPGGFCEACLCNDFVQAVTRADATNQLNLDRIAQWLWNECPSGAWGNKDKVNAWVSQGGTLGTLIEDESSVPDKDMM